MRKRSRVYKLSGYSRLGATKTSTKSSSSFGVGDGITAGTNLFTSIFNPLVQKKSDTQLAELANERAKTDTLLAQAQAGMANAQTEAERVRLQQLQTQLMQSQAEMDERQQNLVSLSQVQKPSITPIGYGVIALGVGAGIFAIKQVVK